MKHREFHLILILSVLSTACATPVGRPGTIGSLEKRDMPQVQTQPARADLHAVRDHYLEFLRTAPDDHPEYDAAVKRVASLEMELGDERRLNTDVSQNPRQAEQAYQRSVKLYEYLLKKNPQGEKTEEVLYQLAKAYQHAGDFNGMVSTLLRLRNDYPDGLYSAEARFRLAEYYFETKQYEQAARLYAEVVRQHPDSPFYRNSAYKLAWSQAKGGAYEQAVNGFLVLLKTLTLADEFFSQPLAGLRNVNDATLVEDILRGINLSILDSSDSLFFAAIKHQQMQAYEYELLVSLGRFYVSKGRVQDAVTSYYEYIESHNNAQALLLEAELIDLLQQEKLKRKSFAAKQRYVRRVLRYRQNHTQTVSDKKLLQRSAAYAEEIAHAFHDFGNSKKQNKYIRQSLEWYRIAIQLQIDEAPTMRLRRELAEAYVSVGQYAPAMEQYEQLLSVATREQGEALLYAYIDITGQALQQKPDSGIQEKQIQAMAAYVDNFPRATHRQEVLASLIAVYFETGRDDLARQYSEQALVADNTKTEVQQVAGSVQAQLAVKQGRLAEARQWFLRLLTNKQLAEASRRAYRADLQAVSIKIAENHRAKDDDAAAVEEYRWLLAEDLAGQHEEQIRFELANALLRLEQWQQAAQALADYRQRYPRGSWQSQAVLRLAFVYEKLNQPQQAADEYLRSTSSLQHDKAARLTLKAAQLYEGAKDIDQAVAAYKKYIYDYQPPATARMPVQKKLSELYLTQNQHRKRKFWLKKIRQTKAADDAALSMIAWADFELTEYDWQIYENTPLVEPLRKSLKNKQQLLQRLSKQYQRLIGYSVVEYASAASFRLASLYQNMARALMNSPRPQGLSKLELEEYELMLEEQAIPFEQQAMAIHEENIRRAKLGYYDQWVAQSYDALASMAPVAYQRHVEFNEVYAGLD